MRVSESKSRSKLHFVKMHGTGNDYIFFNCFDMKIENPSLLSRALSDRNTGVGGDGIVLILPSSVADAKMHMFNADGSEGSMCGNAIRCVGKLLFEENIVKKTFVRIETQSGIKELFLFLKDNKVTSVKVDMGAAKLHPQMIPVNLDGDSVIARSVDIGGIAYSITCVSMGNPHAIVFCDDIDSLKLSEIGPMFENNELFPDRVNASFVKPIDRTGLEMRVWERGSGETKACGTGACAVVTAAVLNNLCDKDTDINVRLPGGKLIIRYTDKTVFMTGDCIKVFEGVTEI